MIQLRGRSQTLPLLSLLFPPSTDIEKERKEKEVRWKRMKKNEKMWIVEKMESPFSLHSRDQCTTPSILRRSSLRLLVFVVAFVVFCLAKIAQHYTITVWPAVYCQDKRHIVNRALNFPFTHFLLLHWCWASLCLNLVGPELNHILGNTSYSSADWHICRSVV